MARLRIPGEVAVVSPGTEVARDAASRLAALLPGARLVPLSTARFLALARANEPLPVILAPRGLDEVADRRFLAAARDRFLWKAPTRDVYDAISGFLTALAPRRMPAARAAPGGAFRTALLLEGRVDRARAALALASPARDWIVEHPGMVRISDRGMSELRRQGVRWLALTPVRLLGVTDGTGAARSIFPRGLRVWCLGPAPRFKAPSSRARGRRPSRK